MTSAAVIGLGTMGPGIAATLAWGGMAVRAYDSDENAAAGCRGLIDGAGTVLTALGMPDQSEQLRGITCCPAWDEGTLVRSGPDAVALALERHTSGENAGRSHGATDAVQMKFAPEAIANGNGNGNGYQASRKCPDCNGGLAYQEGCFICLDCGYSTCG